MEIRPILSALMRTRTGALLVALQIAITLAVISNALFIIDQRIEKIRRPTGVDSDNLLFAQSYGFAPGYDHLETTRADLEALRALPGVIAASPINQIPLSGGGSASTYQTRMDPDAQTVNANYFEVDEQGTDALGAQLLEGRAFLPQEIVAEENQSSRFVPAIILTRSLAQELYGDEHAVGRTLYDGLGQSATVVGVMADMQGSWVDSDRLTKVVLHSRIPARPAQRYVIRTEPGRRDAVLADVEHVLATSNHDRVITWVRPHEYFIEHSYKRDVRMVVFLGVLVVWMTLLTALGVVGLASFLVRARTRQIGTRRAIGATRADIVRYFMIENGLLTTGGALLGVLLAFAFGQWLSAQYGLPRLEPGFVAIGFATLVALGQLAVLVPARRAAAIPPAIATRTV
jgi:putative ABC transport system permease protein